MRCAYVDRNLPATRMPGALIGPCGAHELYTVLLYTKAHCRVARISSSSAHAASPSCEVSPSHRNESSVMSVNRHRRCGASSALTSLDAMVIVSCDEASDSTIERFDPCASPRIDGWIVEANRCPKETDACVCPSSGLPARDDPYVLDRPTVEDPSEVKFAVHRRSPDLRTSTGPLESSRPYELSEEIQAPN
jgi:hypothetical protein